MSKLKRYNGTAWETLVIGSGNTAEDILYNSSATYSTGTIGNVINGKVAKEQGVAHAGEFLVVGSDGNVTTMAMQTWQGGSY